MKNKLFLFFSLLLYVSCNKALYYINPDAILCDYKYIAIVPFSEKAWSIIAYNVNISNLVINEISNLFSSIGFQIITQNELDEFSDKMKKQTLFCIIDYNEIRSGDVNKFYSYINKGYFITLELYDTEKKLIYASATFEDARPTKKLKVNDSGTIEVFYIKKAISYIFNGIECNYKIMNDSLKNSNKVKILD